MSPDQMRVWLKKLYGEQWAKKVDAMPDDQVVAVYTRFLNQGKFKGVK